MLSKGKTSYIKVFAALSLCVSIYLFGYLLEINSFELQEMIFWNQVQYIGLPFFPVLWLLMALLYTKGKYIISRWKLVFLFIIPVLTFFFRMTNSFHQLYYHSFQLQHTAEFSLLHLVKGPWYYVHSTYLLFCLLLTTILFYGEYKKSISLNHSRFRILLVASVIPHIGLALILLDFLELGLDYTAFFMPISLLLIMLSILKYDFLEVKTLARETIFENCSDGMVLLDMEHRILDYNKEAQCFFSSFKVVLQNRYIDDIMTGQKEVAEVFKGEASQEFRLARDGRESCFEITSTVMENGYGSKIGILKSIRDVTEKKMIQERLKLLASIDELCGLNNRRYFMELLQKEYELARVYDQYFSILLIDIDHFKAINDTKGHAAGDFVIREFGKLIKENFRKTDFSGRLGGEEFAIVLTNTSFDAALQVAEEFREKVAKTEMLYENHSISMTISIGVTSFFNEAKSFEEILNYADEAMYESKARGRNCTTVKFYS
jgi:diguanylate cyclase (GGDEF)-like protein/PAS domain S-box-containing protein